MIWIMYLLILLILYAQVQQSSMICSILQRANFNLYSTGRVVKLECVIELNIYNSTCTV